MKFFQLAKIMSYRILLLQHWLHIFQDLFLPKIKFIFNCFYTSLIEFFKSLIKSSADLQKD